MRFHAIIKEGKLKFSGSRLWVQSKIAELGEGEYDVIIQKHFAKRSEQQNKYYWAVVCPLVMEGLRKQGFEGVLDVEDAHDIIKPMFWSKSVYSEQLGELKKDVSSTKFTREEFSERMEMIAVWAYDFLGVTIPAPNSQAALAF